MKKTIGVLVLLLTLLGGSAYAAAPKAGDTAPGFKLVSVDGKSVSLEDYKGKVVLVGMFHIGMPCMNQAMEFNKVRKAITSPDLVILGINTSGDSKQEVLDYMEQFPESAKFPYLLDPEHSVNSAYIQRDMPTVLIIGKDGVIHARTPGVGSDQLVPYIKKML